MLAWLGEIEHGSCRLVLESDRYADVLLAEVVEQTHVACPDLRIVKSFAEVLHRGAPVKDLREAFDDPQVRARDMRLLDDLGQEHIGVPIRFQNEPARPVFDLPQPGQHTRSVLRAIGYADDALTELERAGVI